MLKLQEVDSAPVADSPPPGITQKGPPHSTKQDGMIVYNVPLITSALKKYPMCAKYAMRSVLEGCAQIQLAGSRAEWLLCKLLK